MTAPLGRPSPVPACATPASAASEHRKEDLFLACVARLADSRVQVWKDFIANAKELGARPETFGKVLVSVLFTPQWNKAMVEFRIAAISETSRQALIDNQRRWRNIVIRLLEVYRTTNDLSPKVPVETLADSLVAAADGLRFQALTEPDVDIAGIFATTLKLLLAGSQNPGRPEAAAVAYPATLSGTPSNVLRVFEAGCGWEGSDANSPLCRPAPRRAFYRNIATEPSEEMTHWKRQVGKGLGNRHG